MKPAFVIERVSASETRPLRQRVLRPHQTVESLVLPGEDDPTTTHFAAKLDGAVIGVAAIYRKPPPGEDDAHAFQLRGMATAPEHRRSGIGAALVRAAVDAAARKGGRVLWCNARTGALEFYRALGFQPRGDVFDLPEIGPHVLMWRAI